MSDQLPSIGRIVIYVPHLTEMAAINSSTEVAAIVAGLNRPAVPEEKAVSLHLFTNGAGTIYKVDVLYNADKVPGTWHWPERK